eukprot:Gb_05832 [translate_table: standard]
MPINTIKPLRKLNIASFLPKIRIHHKTHCLTQGLAVIYVVITIKIQQERAIGKDSRNTNQCIHCTSFLVVLESRPLFTRYID